MGEVAPKASRMKVKSASPDPKLFPGFQPVFRGTMMGTIQAGWSTPRSSASLASPCSVS